MQLGFAIFIYCISPRREAILWVESKEFPWAHLMLAATKVKEEEEAEKRKRIL